MFCDLSDQTNPTISLGKILGIHYGYVFRHGLLGIGINPIYCEHSVTTTCSKLGQPTLDSALKQGKESLLLLLSLVYQSSKCAHLPLVITFIAGAY